MAAKVNGFLLMECGLLDFVLILSALLLF